MGKIDHSLQNIPAESDLVALPSTAANPGEKFRRQFKGLAVTSWISSVLIATRHRAGWCGHYDVMGQEYDAERETHS